MSIAEDHPEQRPAGLPPIRKNVDPIDVAASFIEAYRDEGPCFTGNVFDAEINGEPPTVLAQMRKNYGDAYSLLTMQTDTFLRQAQAFQVIQGIFFEGINRTYAQTQEFVDRDVFGRVIETEPEMRWHERLEGYELVEGIDIPWLSSKFQLCAAPRIRTTIPSKNDSLELGYMSSSGGFQTIENHEGQTIDAGEVQKVSLPLLGKLSLSHKLEDGGNLAIPAERHRHAAARHIQNLYRRAWNRELPSITCMDAVVVVPGISGTGNVESTDLFIDLGSNEGDKAGDYKTTLLINGQTAGEHYLGANASNRTLGVDSSNTLFSFPALPEMLPSLPRKAFTRETEDMTLSLIALPVLQSGFNRRKPLMKFSGDTQQPIHYQLDPKRPCFLGHVSLVGSY